MMRRFQEVARDQIGEVTSREESQPSITCPLCAKTSYHPKDIEEGYCGFCHWWTGRADLLADFLETRLQQAVVDGVAGQREVSTGLPFHRTLTEALVLLLQRR